MNIILFGITGLGNAALEQLLELKKKPSLVVTRREYKEDPHLKLPNLGEISKKYCIPVEYDKSFVDGRFDLCIVATYHKKINLKINNFKKAFNIHPSYLPDYKGKDPIKDVLLNKEIFTGVSVHFLNEEFDSGKIIMQKKISIEKLIKKSEIMKKMYPIYKRFTKELVINFDKI
jgi:methionyl-tRNA formyltransferase